MNTTDLPDLDALTPGARRILEAAETLFYERGITAVGVDLVAAESGVTKRTLYNRFGSKDALIAAYLADRDRRWRAVVDDAVAARRQPMDRVLAPFDALGDWVGRNPRGCAFVNALAELPDVNHPGHRVAVAEKRWLRELWVRLLTEAGTTDPDALATRLLCLHEGALAMQLTAPDTDSVTVARETARALLTSELGAD